MKSRRDEFEAAPPLVRFLERIRKSFSHDLRTPLGTIVNYAAVLEANQGSDAEEVRDLGRRIRSNAQRVARMVQLLATATSLASRPMQSDPTDLVALAKSVLGDGGGAGRVLSSGNPKQLFADVDAEIVGFAWRAFVAVQNDARGKPIDELEIAIQPAEAVVWIDVASHSGESSSSTRALTDVVVELPIFLRHNNGAARLESAMGLGLAQDLVISHGGELIVSGKPGLDSGMRLRFSRSAA